MCYFVYNKSSSPKSYYTHTLIIILASDANMNMFMFNFYCYMYFTCIICHIMTLYFISKSYTSMIIIAQFYL